MIRPPRIHDFVPRAFGDDLIEVQPLDAAHPVHRMGLHGHTFGELMLVTGGTGRHRVNGRWHRAERGRLFVLGPGDVHDCGELASAVGWLVLLRIDALSPGAAGPAVAADAPLLRCFTAGAASRPAAIDLDDADCADWERALRLLADELASRRPLHRRAVDAATRLLLVDLARRLPARDDPSPTERAGPALVERALAYIDAHYLEDIGPRDVAAHTARTSAHLTTALRRRTGRTLAGWIVERRMAEARRLLVATDLPIGVIAGRVRYADADGFARAFRRLHRAGPASWRRLHR